MRWKGPAVRPAESAGRHRRRAEPPEPNWPSRTAAKGTAGSFRPAQSGGTISETAHKWAQWQSEVGKLIFWVNHLLSKKKNSTK